MRIYTHPFSKRFSHGDIYLYLLFSCTCARVHILHVIVQHVKTLILMRNSLSVGFCFTLKRTCCFVLSFEKCPTLAVQICDGESFGLFWE